MGCVPPRVWCIFAYGYTRCSDVYFNATLVYAELDGSINVYGVQIERDSSVEEHFAVFLFAFEEYSLKINNDASIKYIVSLDKNRLS